MTPQDLLNADMATIGRWIRSGFRWWMNELSELFPTGLGTGGRGPIAYFDGDADLRMMRDGTLAEAVPASRTTRLMTIILPVESCLVRSIELPRMSASDLGRYVLVDADRLMPAPAGRMLLSAERVGEAPGEGRMTVDIAGLPSNLATRLLDQCRMLDVRPTRIAIYDADARTGRRFDFLPAMQAAGLFGRAGSGRPFWWAVAAFLLAVNIAALVYRDVAKTSRLEQLVQQQQPAVAIAERIKRRLVSGGKVIDAAVAQRRGGNPIEALAVVTAAFPPNAWLQRFEWKGSDIHLAGYKQTGVDMIGTLRKSPRLADVRQTTGEALADIPVGQPFELSARVKRR